MSRKPLTQDSIAEQLRFQIRSRISGITYLLIPLLFACVIVILWILILLLGGKLTPTSSHLIISSAVLTAILVLGTVGYRTIVARTINKHPFMSQTPEAMARILALSREERRNMGLAGRASVYPKYHITTLVQQIESLYKVLLQRHFDCKKSPSQDL